MLPETQRERLADTLGEGTCRHRHRGDGSGAAGKFPESVPQGLMRLGLSPGARARPT